MYSTDSVLYTISNGGGVGSTPTAKWFSNFYTDSIHSFQLWDDTGGYLESLGYKVYATITVPAGNFENCFFYKQRFNSGFVNNNSGWYIYVKPGVGIVKSRSIGGATGNTLTRISTLLSYHIE